MSLTCYGQFLCTKTKQLNITFPNPAGGYLALASPGGHLTPAPCPDTCCLIIDFKSYPNKKKSILGPLKCFPQLLSTYNLESKAACKIMLKLIHVKHCFQIHSWPYSLSTFSSHSVFLCLKFVTNNLENYCKFFLSFSFDCCFLFKSGTYPLIYSNNWYFYMRNHYMRGYFSSPYISHITRSTCTYLTTLQLRDKFRNLFAHLLHCTVLAKLINNLIIK